MRYARAGTHLLVAALMALVLVTAATPVGPSRAGALGGQEEPPRAELSIASISPWVPADGEFQIRFDPNPDVPPDAELSVTVFQALTPSRVGSVRDEVADIIDGAVPGRVLRNLPTRQVAELGDPAGGSVLSIPIRGGKGDSDRVYVPEAGVHPVELVLTSSDGPELWRQVVFLNRLDEGDSEAEAADDTATDTADTDSGGSVSTPTAVSLVVGLDAPPSIGEDGTAVFSPESRSRLRAVAAQIDAIADVPLVLGPEPNTLDGLSRSDEAWAAQVLSSVRRPLAAATVLQRPYVPVDTGALVASDGAPLLGRQAGYGTERLIAHLAVTPQSRLWALDDTVTNESLPALGILGVTSLLVDPSALESDESGGDGGDEAVAAAMSRPARLATSDSISVIASDSQVASMLARPASEPALRAHDAVTLLMATRFDRVDAGQLYAAVVVPGDVDPAALTAFVGTLSGGGPLRAASGDEVGPSVDLDEPDAPTVRLRERSVGDLRAVVERANVLELQISSYADMTDDQDPSVALWWELFLQSLDRSLDSAQRRALDDAIVAALSQRLSQIHPPHDRRVVLTSSETEIPLRMRNDLPFPVHLVLHARSARLDVPASYEIVLDPGENRIDLPVTVQAPGESLLRITFTSPDGRLTLPGTDVPVRSTAISGVGAALSIISGIFLLVWWVRSGRRSRRHRDSDGDQHGDHPEGRATGSSEDAGSVGRSG